MWIPLDILLTINIAFYHFIHVYKQNNEILNIDSFPMNSISHFNHFHYPHNKNEGN
jgi:hypothetical protein